MAGRWQLEEAVGGRKGRIKEGAERGFDKMCNGRTFNYLQWYPNCSLNPPLPSISTLMKRAGAIVHFKPGLMSGFCISLVHLLHFTQVTFLRQVQMLPKNLWTSLIQFHQVLLHPPAFQGTYYNFRMFDTSFWVRGGFILCLCPLLVVNHLKVSLYYYFIWINVSTVLKIHELRELAIS